MNNKFWIVAGGASMSLVFIAVYIIYSVITSGMSILCKNIRC